MFNIGDRVELKSQGWVGTVRDLKPKAGDYYVEWDHGEALTWVYEHRLRLAEPESPAERIVREAERQRDEERCPTCGAEHNEEVSRQERFLESAEEANQAILDSEAFFLVTVQQGRHPDYPGTPVWVPMMVGGSLHDEAVSVVEAQVALMTLVQFQEMIHERLKDRDDRDDD